MAIQAYIKLNQLETQKLFDSMVMGPSMLDIMRELVEKQDEDLLAVMAAGVPANCIALIPPGRSTYDFRTNTVSIGFKFIRSI